MVETVIQIDISRQTSYGADANPMIIPCVQKLYELTSRLARAPCLSISPLVSLINETSLSMLEALALTADAEGIEIDYDKTVEEAHVVAAEVD